MFETYLQGDPDSLAVLCSYCLATGLLKGEFSFGGARCFLAWLWERDGDFKLEREYTKRLVEEGLDS